MALVPFLTRLADPDLYCFKAGGAVCRWDHETGEAPEVEKTFPEIFAFEVQELRKRKDRKKAEPGAVPNAGSADASPASVS